MKAAVVTSFEQPPRYGEFASPVPASPHDEVVEVLASGLHPRVRSQADGSHYTSTDELPLVPGIDGVGRRENGELVYFVLGDGPLGAMAERTLIDTRRSVTLPADVDPVAIAAAMNPAMSSWIPLRTRVDFRPGQSVLVLGATGSAGRLALQTAKRLGADRIVAAGRGAERVEALRDLGATHVVDLSAEPDAVAAQIAATSAEVDVVLDYLWGSPTEAAIPPLLKARGDRSRALDWIEIGAVAGPEIALPSTVLRQANVRFLGSGQGSASVRAIVESLPALAAEIIAGTYRLDADAVPLRDVEAAWATRASQRVVLVP
ncbi:NADPH:quinone reductase-like Zn-dependent oxidoreductase [Frondihabitans sp. PhB188]|uniref:quinone oxidoreductase family protein n=1 Tax=Frondihabitans sp. PhB188 TaxID=2485200 RepID=UPI000F4607E6|nr:zinc-binding alcohol dehydrogenase family protein [Frondihabitans sp. PhB188]ROQ40867.1 NADPH:quinone reductase-like Zn-dependent oxidoreductase [Frondihabitans sp. PhB188]